VVGRPVRDPDPLLVAAQGHLPDLRVDRGRRLPVEPEQQVAKRVADRAVPARQHVHHGLRPDDLGGRRHERRHPRLPADRLDLALDLGEAVEGVHLPELADEVGDHPAGYLVGDHVLVDQGQPVERDVLFVPGRQGLQVTPDLQDPVHGDARVTLRSFQREQQGLHGRHRGPHRVGGHTGVHDVHSGLDGLQAGHRRHAAGVMGVEVQGDPDGLPELGEQREGVVGRQDAGHVLDADRVGAHLLQGPGLRDIVGQVEDLAAQVPLRERVDDGAFEVLAVGPDAGGGGLEVAQVVQGVEDAEDVDPDLAGPVDEGPDDVVGVVPVADEVLAAQEHGEGGLPHVPLQDARPLPGVLVQEPVHRVEGGASPDLHRPEPRLVHPLGDGDHVFRLHPGRVDRLVAVAEGVVLELHRAHGSLRFLRVRTR